MATDPDAVYKALKRAVERLSYIDLSSDSADGQVDHDRPEDSELAGCHFSPVAIVLAEELNR